MPEAQELSDRLELRALVDRYARIPDDREYSLVDAIFTEDATLVGPGFELSGRELIRQGMQAIEQYSATLHSMHGQVVEIEGNEATGDTWCTANHVHEKEGRPHKLDWGIRYKDHYRRETQGWRIARRELVLIWTQELPL